MRFILLIIFCINIASADCMGDVNFDNSIDTEDIIMMVQHILHMNIMDTISFQNADMDGNSNVNIYDLSRLVDIIMESEDCNGFTPIDLSLDWETEQDVSYFDSELLNQVINENIGQMSSGWPENWAYMYLPHPLNSIINTALIWSPGSSWLYNNSVCHLNSHVINELTEMSPRAFAMENLFPQLGISDPYWADDQADIHNGSYDLHLTLREMVKLGQLYLQEGHSLNEEVLYMEWINDATSRQINNWYGYLWWLPGVGYLAVGLGGQYIAVIPELDLVVGTHSTTQSTDAYTDQLLSYIYNQIVPIFDFEGRVNDRTLYLDQIREY